MTFIFSKSASNCCISRSSAASSAAVFDLPSFWPGAAPPAAAEEEDEDEAEEVEEAEEEVEVEAAAEEAEAEAVEVVVVAVRVTLEEESTTVLLWRSIFFETSEPELLSNKPL
jgi:hypothetical protein